MDIEASYHRELGSGQLALRFLASYIRIFIRDRCVMRVDRAGRCGPGSDRRIRYRRASALALNASATYNQGPFHGLTLSGRFVDGGKYSYLWAVRHRRQPYFQPVYLKRVEPIPPNRQGRSSCRSVRGGEQLARQGSPVDPTAFFQALKTEASLYDVIGRTVTVGVRFNY